MESTGRGKTSQRQAAIEVDIDRVHSSSRRAFNLGLAWSCLVPSSPHVSRRHVSVCASSILYASSLRLYPSVQSPAIFSPSLVLSFLLASSGDAKERWELETGGQHQPSSRIQSFEFDDTPCILCTRTRRAAELTVCAWHTRGLPRDHGLELTLRHHSL
eukprot:2300527-Rhodomonas_salina.8